MNNNAETSLSIFFLAQMASFLMECLMALKKSAPSNFPLTKKILQHWKSTGEIFFFKWLKSPECGRWLRFITLKTHTCSLNFFFSQNKKFIAGLWMDAVMRSKKCVAIELLAFWFYSFLQQKCTLTQKPPVGFQNPRVVFETHGWVLKKLWKPMGGFFLTNLKENYSKKSAPEFHISWKPRCGF